jgi:hypothetical protein
MKIMDSVMRDYKKYLEDFFKSIYSASNDRVKALSLLFSDNKGRIKSNTIEIFGD